MAAVIHSERRIVGRRLSQYFNSTRDQWISVVKAMVAARAGCTVNNAKSSPGFYAWDGGIRRSREIFGKEGWMNGDDDGIETIVNHDFKRRVTVMNTDAGTADKSRTPRNRTPKGPATEKVVDLNDQIEMFKRKETGAFPEDDFELWYLCVFDNGRTVRAELSRPVEFKSNYFVKFSERIFILEDGDWEKVAIASPSGDADPGLKIDVRRK